MTRPIKIGNSPKIIIKYCYWLKKIINNIHRMDQCKNSSKITIFNLFLCLCLKKINKNAVTWINCWPLWSLSAVIVLSMFWCFNYFIKIELFQKYTKPNLIYLPLLQTLHMYISNIRLWRRFFSLRTIIYLTKITNFVTFPFTSQKEKKQFTSTVPKIIS